MDIILTFNAGGQAENYQVSMEGNGKAVSGNLSALNISSQHRKAMA